MVYFLWIRLSFKIKNLKIRVFSIKYFAVPLAQSIDPPLLRYKRSADVPTVKICPWSFNLFQIQYKSIWKQSINIVTILLYALIAAAPIWPLAIIWLWLGGTFSVPYGVNHLLYKYYKGIF